MWLPEEILQLFCHPFTGGFGLLDSFLDQKSLESLLSSETIGDAVLLFLLVFSMAHLFLSTIHFVSIFGILWIISNVYLELCPCPPCSFPLPADHFIPPLPGNQSPTSRKNKKNIDLLVAFWGGLLPAPVYWRYGKKLLAMCQRDPSLSFSRRIPLVLCNKQTHGERGAPGDGRGETRGGRYMGR